MAVTESAMFKASFHVKGCVVGPGRTILKQQIVNQKVLSQNTVHELA